MIPVTPEMMQAIEARKQEYKNVQHAGRTVQTFVCGRCLSGGRTLRKQGDLMVCADTVGCTSKQQKLSQSDKDFIAEKMKELSDEK